MTGAAVEPALAQAVLDARKGHARLEPLHGFVYFDRGAAERYAALGVTDPREQYFGSRSAPMGAVGPGVVVATFFNFCPLVVAQAVPAVWSRASPEQLVGARQDAALATYQQVFGGDDVSELLDLLGEMVGVIRPLGAGRALFGGYADLPEPTEPLRLLFHRITLVREWRGDGHVAALTAAGVDPCEVLHVHAATGTVNGAVLKATRAWPADRWEAARRQLVDRGELTSDGELTEHGRSRRDAVERQTDVLAAAPWLALGPERSERVRELAKPYAQRALEVSGLAAMIKR